MELENDWIFDVLTSYYEYSINETLRRNSSNKSLANKKLCCNFVSLRKKNKRHKT